MGKADSWFVASKKGLRALNADKPKSFVIRELLQNAWDENGVTKVDVELAHDSAKRKLIIRVEDDAPEGFYDIRHAFTLFADTRKRGDPTKRGRFNLGEKQVLSLCDWSHIQTTTGTVEFNKDGTRSSSKSKTESGSIFRASMSITRAEYDALLKDVWTFLQPKSITTTVNGRELLHRVPEQTFETKLATEVTDDEGNLRGSTRNTTVDVHIPLKNEPAMLYEMGLPVCETGDRWHYNVNQRVPLTSDRDNVRPSYLQDLRAEVLNVMHEELTEEEASESWVREAMEDDRVDAEAVKTVIKAQQGDDIFVPVPGDPEANERAMDEGYRPVSGGSYSAAAWNNIRGADALPSSVDLVGATRVVSGESVSSDKWTADQKRIARLTRYLAHRIFKLDVSVRMYKAPRADEYAQYGDRSVAFNLSKLRKSWFKNAPAKQHVDLLVHEIAHEYGNHYDRSYHEALTKAAAELAFFLPSELEEVVENEEWDVESLIFTVA